MSGGTRTQEFRLVGPHAGKDMIVNGHEFVDGEYHYSGNEEQIKALTNVFSCYAAFTPEAIEQMGLDVTAPAPDATVVGSADNKPNDGKSELLLNLADAIAALDPANEAHWTGTGLPAMAAIEDLMGDKTVTRADVEAQAGGYTRDKARALRG